MCIYVCVWGCLDKYISVATWPPQTKIPGSAPAHDYMATMQTCTGADKILTGADILAPPLPPTDKADTDDRNTKEHPTPLPSLELQIPH